MTVFAQVDKVAGALDFHLTRENLIAANIANVDTPGYVPKELHRPERLFSESLRVHMERTDPRHMGPDPMAPQAHYELEEVRDHLPGNDLNYVDLDREMAKLSANALRYETVAKLVSKQLGILSYAAQDRH